ncbi:MAG: trehalase family glycosidase [bacterium]
MKSTARILLAALAAAFLFMPHADAAPGAASKSNAQLPAIGPEYAALKKNLAVGWNTWDAYSVLTHVLLPAGFALKINLMDDATGKILTQGLIGRRGADEENIRPGLHSYDGSYTELTLEWRGIAVRIQTASVNGEFFLLATSENNSKSGTLIIKPEMLYGKSGTISIDKNIVSAQLPSKTISVFADGNFAVAGDGLSAQRIAVSLDGPAGLSTGAKKSLAEIKRIIEAEGSRFAKSREKYGELSDAHNAMQSALAWNVIYEPTQDRVITPVSRLWCVGWGGFVLFDWDTYFAAYMLSLDSKELAYATAIEVTKGITGAGFVPNYSAANNNKSLDRSQPPVGSLVVREIYRKYREKWFLREVFDDLLSWNRWWEPNRMTDGYLCWGSNPFKGYYGKIGELHAINNWQGAAWESGLDNSPMYDDVPFDTKRHQLKLADVGLISFYAMDCDALADIADELGKTEESRELRARAEKHRQALATLWDGTFGLYLNKRTDTKEFSYRISPANFYPLLARAATQQQAERMMKDHFYNPAEFWGDWIIPSISRNDPGFKDNSYWRGRIWAPMNFLVYIGMRNYDLPDARKDLVDKSKKLLLKSWLAEGHVYENYNSVTGAGDDVENSDKFYHWGALLGFISFIEQGFVEAPEKPLN